MDLFNELMPLLSKGDPSLINDMTDEQVKSVATFVALKMMSGGKGNSAEYSILAVNEVANKGWWEYKDHPRLQLMLLCLCATPGKWKYFPGNLKSDNKVFKYIRTCYPHFKDDEINMVIELSTKDDLIQLAQDFGMQDKEMKQWKKDLKAVIG